MILVPIILSTFGVWLIKMYFHGPNIIEKDYFPWIGLYYSYGIFHKISI